MKTYFTLFLIFFFSSIYGQTWNGYTTKQNKMSLVKNGASIILKAEAEDKSVTTIKGTCSILQDKVLNLNYSYYIGKDYSYYKCPCDKEDSYMILKIRKSDQYARFQFYNSLDSRIGEEQHLGTPK